MGSYELGGPSLHDPKLRARLLLLDLDVVHLGVNAQRQVRGQRPWRGGPGDEGRLRLVQQGECDDHRRVVHVLVVEIFLRSTAVDVDQTSAGAGEGQVRETAGARVAVRTSKLEIGVAQAME